MKYRLGKRFDHYEWQKTIRRKRHANQNAKDNCCSNTSAHLVLDHSRQKAANDDAQEVSEDTRKKGDAYKWQYPAANKSSHSADGQSLSNNEWGNRGKRILHVAARTAPKADRALNQAFAADNSTAVDAC